MTDLEWLREITRWMGMHPVILLLCISAGAIVGLLVMAAVSTTKVPDTVDLDPWAKQQRAERTANPAAQQHAPTRQARIDAHMPPSDDEHAIDIGAC